MLLYLSRWHIANERNPFGEARLLCFANGGAQAQFTPEPGPDDEPVEDRGRVAPNANPAPTPLITGAQQNTRSQLDATLQAGDNAEQKESTGRLNPETVFNNAESMKKKLEDLRGNIATVLKKLPKNSEFSKIRQTWLAYKDELEAHIGPVRDSWEIAKTIQEWNSGNTPPSDFVHWLKEHRAGISRNAGVTPQADPQIAAAETIISQSSGVNATDPTGERIPDVTSNQWETFKSTYDKSDQIHAIGKISDAANIQIELLDIHNYISTLEKVIKDSKVEEDLKKTLENIEAMNAAEERAESSGGFPLAGLLTDMEWVSIMDLYQGGKGWWDAMQSAWDNKAQLRAGKVQSRVANMFRWLPFGEAAAQESEKKLDGQHRDNKGKFRGELDDRKPKFIDLFGPDNMFRKAVGRKNPDEIMAIIEYAADTGWLYTFKEDKLIDYIDVKQYLPSHWDDNRRNIYIDNLVDQNQNGLEKVRSSTKESVSKKYEKKMDFLNKEFDGYMRDINFSAAQGIMEAMYGRAIDGDEGPYIAARFFRILRDPKNVQIRRYMTPIIVQDFARLSAGKGFFTMSNLWMDRNYLPKAAQDLSKPLDMKNAGMLASTIAKAEDRIKALAGKDLDDDKLEEFVAKFLAGNVLQFSGGTLSIWDKEFADYRNEDTNHSFAVMDSSGVKNTDNDYFAGNSEVLMANKAFTIEIFDTTSTGTWEHADKTQNFVGAVIRRYKELLDGYPNLDPHDDNNPAEIFRKELSDRIQRAIGQSISRSDTIWKYEIKTGNKTDDTPALGALQELGFLDLEALGDIGKKHKANIAKDEKMQEALEKMKREKFGVLFGRNQRAPNSTSGISSSTSAPAAPKTQEQRDAEDFRQGKTMWPGGLEKL